MPVSCDALHAANAQLWSMESGFRLLARDDVVGTPGTTPDMALCAKVGLLHNLFAQPDDPHHPAGNFEYHARQVHEVVKAYTSSLWPVHPRPCVLTTSVCRAGRRLHTDELVIHVAEPGRETAPLFSMHLGFEGDRIVLREFFVVNNAVPVKLFSSPHGICARRRDADRRRAQLRPTLRSLLACGSPTGVSRTDTAVLSDVTHAAVVERLPLDKLLLSPTTHPPPLVRQ